jgi:hypothetical protein
MEVNCVSSECDATVEHGVKAKDTFTHDSIYFLILGKLSYSQHLVTEMKDPRFDVLAIVNIKFTISPTLKMQALESICCTAWPHTPGA